MKLSALFIFLSLSILSTIACTKEELPGKTPCDFTSEETSLLPLCSFNPKIATTVQFPVHVLYNGERISSPNYSFLWSKDPDFGGSAISVSYDQLPLEVTVTEESSGCDAIVSIDQSYWD